MESGKETGESSDLDSVKSSTIIPPPIHSNKLGNCRAYCFHKSNPSVTIGPDSILNTRKFIFLRCGHFTRCIHTLPHRNGTLSFQNCIHSRHTIGTVLTSYV